jgi:MFS family permease
MNIGGARRWWALGAIQLAVLAVGLDITVLSVALPTLATALHAAESDLQWFSSGYTLVLAAAMLPVGLLGDRYGRKKVMLSSLALFGAGSAACAYAPTAAAFLVARLALGLAGAGVIVLAASALTVLFSEMDVSLRVSAGIAAAGIVITRAFLPGRVGRHTGGSIQETEEELHAVTG